MTEGMPAQAQAQGADGGTLSRSNLSGTVGGRRALTRFALALCLTALLLLASASSAAAFDFLTKWGGSGAGDGSAPGSRLEKDVSYELSYVHRKRGIVRRGGLVFLLKSLFDTMALGGSTLQNPLSVAARKAGGNGPAPVAIADADFHVVKLSDLTPAAPGASAHSQAEAFALHDKLVSDDPTLAGELQVVAAHELFAGGRT